MKSSSNLKRVGLKKSFSSNSLSSPPQIQNSSRTQIGQKQLADLHQDSNQQLPQLQNFDRIGANISIGTCDENQMNNEQFHHKRAGSEMAQLQQYVSQGNTAGFNSISSIASEGQFNSHNNNNFASVQSIVTKKLMQNLTSHGGSEAKTGNFHFNSGDAQLDRILESTLVHEINSGSVSAESARSQDEILSQIHQITQQVNLEESKALQVLQQVAHHLSNHFSSQQEVSDGNLNSKPDKLNKDLLFDFCDPQRQQSGKKAKKGSISQASSSSQKAPKKRASSKSKRKTSSSVTRSQTNIPLKSKKKKANLGNDVSVSSLGENMVQQEYKMVYNSSQQLIEQQHEQSELSIEPTKLKRLDLGSILANQTRDEYQSNISSIQQKMPVQQQAAAYDQNDYMLSASVYNGDRPIQKPPKTKPIHLGSLNFSTLKSNESKTSRGNQSFKLPRISLDDTLNRSVEKLIKRQESSDKKKKEKYSPYRSNSTSALGVINSSIASKTSTSALKLRQYTKTQARPLSARTSTPVVPKPGQSTSKKRGLNKSLSKDGKLNKTKDESEQSFRVPLKNRPPMAGRQKPPQPMKKKNKPSIVSVKGSKGDCSVSDTATTMTQSASIPANLKRSESQQSIGSLVDRIKIKAFQTKNANDQMLDYQSQPQIQPNNQDYSNQSLKGTNFLKIHKSVAQIGSFSHRLNATTTAASDNNYTSQQEQTHYDTQSIVTSTTQQQQHSSEQFLDDKKSSHRNSIAILEERLARDVKAQRNKPAGVIKHQKQMVVNMKDFVTFSGCEVENSTASLSAVAAEVKIHQGSLHIQDHHNYSESQDDDQFSKQERKAIRFAQKKLMSNAMGQLARIMHVQRQKSKLATMFHRSRLVARVVQSWSSLKFIERDRAQKASVQLQKVMPLFDRVRQVRQIKEAFKALQKLTLSESAWDLFRLNQLRRCWEEGFLVYTSDNKRKKAVMRDIDELYSKKLLARTLASLSIFSENQKRNSMKKQIASQFYKEHSGYVSKQKSFDALVSFAITAKQSQNAKMQYRFTLLVKSLVSLRDYKDSKQKRDESLKLVQTFYKCSLVTKTMRALKENVLKKSTQRELAFEKQEQYTMARCLSKLRKYANRHSQIQHIRSGAQLKACQLWLDHSFDKVMQVVWRDYPKQELTKDPTNGQQILLKNYLALSKHPQRGMKFFYACNKEYGRHLQSKVLDALYLNAFNRKQRLGQFYMSKLRKVFQNFRRVTVVYRNMRIFRDQRQDTYQNDLIQNVFYALRKATQKLSLLRLSQEKFELKLVKSRAKQHFREWLNISRKVQALEKCEEISHGIDRHRTMTKYIALWFSRLHQKLKQKHLIKLQAQFYQKKTQERFMKNWLQAYQKSQELLRKDMTIMQMQERQSLQRGLKALREYTLKRRMSRNKKGSADQEYIYWLGKRAISQLRRYSHSQRASQEITHMVTSDRAKETKSKVFQAVKLYADYHGQRRRNDQIIIDSIQSKRKSSILKEWTRLYSQRVGVRILAQSLKQSTKRLAVQQIQRVGLLQETNVAMFKEYQPILLMKHCLKTLRKHNRRNQYHKAMHNKLKRERMAKIYRKWRNAFLVEQAKIDFFNKTFICIKNNLAMRAYKTLALNALQGRLKKRADVHRYWSMLKKVIRSLQSRVNRRQRSISQLSILGSINQHTTQKAFFKQWTLRFNKKLALKEALRQHTILKLEKVVRALQEHKYRQIIKKDNVQVLQDQLDMIKARRGLLRFRNICQELRQNKEQTKQAESYHGNYLYRQSSIIWFKHFKQNQVQFGKLKRFRADKTRQQKKTAMQEWIKGSKTALTRVRAAHHTNKLLNRMSARRNFLRWVSEVNYLLNLRAKQENAKNHFKRARISKALQQMNQVTQALIFERQKSAETKQYADRKRMIKSFTTLYRYKQDKLVRSHQKVHALAFNNQNALNKAFQDIKRYQIKQIRLREATKILHKKQLQLYAPQMLQFWFFRAQQRQQVRNKKLSAEDYNINRLQQRSFNALFSNLLNSRDKAHRIKQAEAFHKHKVLDRGVRTLLLYLCHRRDKKEKTIIALQTVGTMQESSVQRQVFDALVFYMKNAKEVRMKAQKQRLHRQLNKAFSALNRRRVLTQNMRKVQHTMNMRVCQSQMIKTWQAWNEAYVIQKAQIAATQTYHARLMLKCFGSIYRHLETRRKLNMALQIRQVTSCVKAFESFKKNAFIGRVKRQLALKAMLHRAHALKVKSLRAFDKVIARNAIFAQVHSNRQLKLASTMFIAWEDQLQVSLMQKDAFYQCRLIVSKHALRRWKHQTDQLDEIERAQYIYQVKLQAKAWNGIRMAAYRTNCHSYIKKQAEQSLQKKFFSEWSSLMDPTKIKAKVLEKKLSKVINLQDYFDSLKRFSQEDKRLERNAAELTFKVQTREAKQALGHWRQMLQVANVIPRLEFISNRQLKKEAFQRMLQNAREKIQEQDQFMSIIDSFSHRRPQNLLQFQKVFLQLVSSTKPIQQNSSSVCSATLAKYVFEKWRNVMPKLSESMRKYRIAQEHCRVTQLKKFYEAMANYSRQVRQQSCISVLLSQTHDDNTLRSVFMQLKWRAETAKRNRQIIQQFTDRRLMSQRSLILTTWSNFQAKRSHYDRVLEHLVQKREIRLKTQYLASMQAVTVKTVMDQSIVQTFDSRRAKTLCWQVIRILRNYAKCQAKRRTQAHLVGMFRRTNLIKRGILSLKLSHSWRVSRHKYSRLFAVFTAWKTTTKENNLLNKYLEECNYKQKAMLSNQSQTIDYTTGGAAASSMRRKLDQRETEEDTEVFSAGQELYYTTRDQAGQLSFADSVIIDQVPAAQYEQHNQQQQQQQLLTQMGQLHHSTIQHIDGEGSEQQLGLTDLCEQQENGDDLSSRDNNFLFGCKPSMANNQRASFKRRFGGETSSDEEPRRY